MKRRSIACAVMALWLVATVSVAQADTGDIIEPQNDPPTPANGWQAGVCMSDAPTKCSPTTPELFFTRAGGHPPIGFTQYIVRHTTVVPNVVEPLVEPLEGRAIKTLRVDLPPGLSVNPLATEERCSLTDFLFQPAPGTFVPQCAASTQVGEEQANVVTNEDDVEFPPGSSNIIENKGTRLPLIAGVFQVPVYNLVPKPGEPALFGFVIAGRAPVFLETDVAWDSDFHQAFKIKLNPASASDLQTIISRLVSFGTSGNGTYITNPTTCFDPNQWQTLYSTWYRAESYEQPNPTFPVGSTPFEARVEDSSGNLYQQDGCDTVPFDPNIVVNPGTAAIDSPAPATVVTELPFEVPGEVEHGSDQAQSHLRKAVVSLPAGMGLNPSGSNGLVACTDGQFKKGVRVYDNECPAASRVGTAEVKTPSLPEPLTGGVYVGEQRSFDPASGEEFRLLVEAKDPDEGVAIRLIGHTAADPTTGRLTTTFDEQEVGPLAGTLPRGLPQAPLESVTLRFDGSKDILTSPPTCATAASSGQMEPWARPGEQVPVSDSFTLTSDPGAGSCPTTLAARRFTPGYTAVTENSVAGANTSFRVHIGRGDGQQEVKGVDVTLPEGLIGSLAGLLYCPEVNLDVAARKSGFQESAGGSCPESSHIGKASTVSGTGSNPITLGGEAYLAGPYKGAPLSLAVITPARSGPFDLGTVVVRVALFVDPETTEITAVSDPIPDVFGGVKLDLRSIDVDVNRPDFMRNGTDCGAPSSTRGSIKGGGGNPANPAEFSSYDVSAYYRPAKCKRLEFKPKLYTKLIGGRNVTQRAKHPKLRAVLEARKGDANLERSALVLPRALFLDQSNIRTVCTRPQLASDTCPKAAIYGHAEARSPLLDGKLKGPVYLVSSDNELPDLLANLRGQVNVHLRGVITSPNGGIKTVFRNTPDVPVSKFILRMQGGKQKGLLINSRNLCKGELSSYMNLKAQNSRRERDKRLPLRVPGCN